HPAVLDCAVVGLPDDKWGERVTAVLQLRPGHEVTAGEIKAFVKGRVGSVKTPKQVEVWPDLPRSRVGKVLKTDVKSRLQGPERGNPALDGSLAREIQSERAISFRLGQSFGSLTARPLARGRMTGRAVPPAECLVSALVTVGPGADAGLVALRVGQHPERPCEGVIDQPSAGRQGGADPGRGLVVGHRDVQVDPVPLRPRAVDLLEPDGRELPGGIDDPVLAVAAGLVGVAE